MKEAKLIAGVLLSAQKEKEMQLLLEDLLTRAEIDDISERIRIVKALLRGKTQRDAARSLGVSISKVTRGSQLIQYGKGALIEHLQ